MQGMVISRGLLLRTLSLVAWFNSVHRLNCSYLFNLTAWSHGLRSDALLVSNRSGRVSRFVVVKFKGNLGSFPVVRSGRRLQRGSGKLNVGLAN